MQESLNFINEGFEHFKKEVDGFRCELAEVKVHSYQQQKESQQLCKELISVRGELIELKQYSRGMNVKIRGLPHIPKGILEGP